VINLKKEKDKKYIHFVIDKDFKIEVEKLASDNKLKVAPYIKWLLNREIQEHKNKKGQH